MLGPLKGLLAARERRRLADERLRQAHAHAFSNHRELLRSDTAGCFYCLSFFNPHEEDLLYIGEDELPEDGDRADDPVNGTALCPRCGIDSVLGSASGYPMTREFFKELHSSRWGGWWVHLAVLIAAGSAVVLAVVLAVVYLSLPWPRIIWGVMGLGVVAFGVEVIVKERIEEFGGDAYDGTPGKPLEGFGAVFVGIALVLMGLGMLAFLVFAPWE